MDQYNYNNGQYKIMERKATSNPILDIQESDVFLMVLKVAQKSTY